MEQNKQSVFTPLGGANQDDSIINPSVDAAGNSLFRNGDYRYALNARIGSSRGDNFNDVENIRDTLGLTAYYQKYQILENNNFNGSIANWSQLDDGPGYPGWTYGSNAARLTLTPGTAPSTVYYPVTIGAPTDTITYPASTYTQLTFPEANLFSNGNIVTIINAPEYTGRVVINAQPTYLIILGAYTTPRPDAQVAYGLGPPVYVPTPKVSQVFYQTTAEVIASKSVSLRIQYSVTGILSSGYANLVFMNGASVISETAIKVGTVLSALYSGVVTIPALCTGVGIRFAGTVSDVVYVDISYFNLNIFKLGAMPDGTNKVIGKLEDTEFQRIYEAVWNENGDHAIRYFDFGTSSTYEILRWSGLAFGENYFVSMAKLDNWLGMTDRNNNPRLVDTNSISDLFLDLGEDDFREFHISFHKWAPTVPPIPRIYYNSVTNNYETLKNKVFHFSYQYEYFGNLMSRCSPISKGCVTSDCGDFYSGAGKLITSIEVDIPGSIYDDPASSSAFNYFDHTDNKFKRAVKYIHLYFRDGEQELWKKWKTVDVNSGFSRYQYFDGKANLTPVDDNDFNQLFDTVPFKAGTIEAIDNRFVFGDCLDEEEPVLGMEATDVAVVVGPTKDWRSSSQSNSGFFQVSTTPRNKLLRMNSLSDLNVKDRGLYKLGIQWLHRNGWRSSIYTTDSFIYDIPDNSGSNNRVLGFNFTLFAPVPEWAVGYQVFRTNVLNINYFMYGISNKILPLIDNVNDILDQTSLPQNVKDRVRQHFENSRLVNADDVIAQAEIEVNNVINDQKAKNKNRNNLLKLNANIGKFSGSPGLAHSNKNFEKYLKVNSIAPKLKAEIRNTKKISTVYNASRLYIDIKNWYFGAIKATDTEYPLNNLDYNFRDGDRVRFTGADVTNPTANQLKEYDVPIIEFDGKAIIVEKPSTLLWIPSVDGTNIRDTYTLEVYTPQKPNQEDHLFFETGEWYPVLYPGTDDRALSKTDFVYEGNGLVTSTAYGPFDIFHKIPFFYGDCYSVAKTVYRDGPVSSVKSSSTVNLSMNPDPARTFDYWDKNNGRVAPAYKNLPVKKFKTTQVRFGGRIIEESLVNAINNFQEDDQFIYPSEYGRIRGLVNTSNAQVESVGSILLAIGEREAWSIYVNRTTLEDLSGSTDVQESDKVLGSYNTLLGSHGTLNPESISKYRGNVYYWDCINGSWVRYGRDGLTPISDYKKRNWFKELATLLLPKYMTDEIPRVISEFDPFNMELVTYINHSSLPGTFRGYEDYKGDTFSESDKRWKHNHSYAPELFAKMNNQLFGYKDGVINQHEAGPGYGTFYGQKYDTKIEPVFNDFPTDVKTWMVYSYTATDGWSIERVLSEYRGQKALQESRIPLDAFEPREDSYFGSFKRDLNTPNVSSPIISGNQLKSKAIQVLMKLDPEITYLSLLHCAKAHFIESPKNG